MRMPRRRVLFTALLLVAGVVAGAVLASGGSASKPRIPNPTEESWTGLVGGRRAAVALGQRMIVVMRAPSLAQRLRLAGGVASDEQERRWTEQALSAQQDVLLKLDTKGIFIKPELRFTRTLNGFSAALDPSAVPALERMPQVAGVYRVRAAYPASVSARPVAAAVRSERVQPLRSTLVGFDGSGVLVALLDTGVAHAVPYLRGHVLNGYDVAGGGIDARARAGPSGAVERHGTEMAGIIVGAGRSGLSGVAPGATVLPIRVGGWQRDDAGRYGVFARTDQILAGLERAVDPDGNGDAHDAARIALIPLVEPFGGFEDGPLALAAAGAAALNTLVVAPAGNDGAAGPPFGSLSGPGGAPAALTVAAADLRKRTLVARLVVRNGLHVLLNREVPVLGAAGPTGSTTLRLVSAKALYTRRGLSRVAARAALVAAGSDPGRAAGEAGRAGASIVLLAGDRLPAGALVGAAALGTPVLGVPPSLVRQAGGAAQLVVSVGRAHVAHGGAAHVAGFSSWGLAYGGSPKPEVVGPGVGIVTVDPGRFPDGSSRFVLVDGASAAAAVVAGQAAIAVQARPELTAADLHSLLVGTAQPLPDEPAAAEGNGRPDIGATAGAEIVARPATLAFGRADGRGWSATRTLTLRNVSTRWLRIFAAAPSPDGALQLSLEPKSLTLAPGQVAEMRVEARLVRTAPSPVLSGALTVAPLSGVRLRVPWAIVTAPVDPALIGTVELSATAFKPSDAAPAVLLAQIGRVVTGPDRVSVEPVTRLDIHLLDRKGRDLGLLARLRDVLPGRYAFGLTGRGPNGGVLPAGRYSLRLLAFPAAGGRAVGRSVVFTIR
jgi:subtilase family protein